MYRSLLSHKGLFCTYEQDAISIHVTTHEQRTSVQVEVGSFCVSFDVSCVYVSFVYGPLLSHIGLFCTYKQDAIPIHITTHEQRLSVYVDAGLFRMSIFSYIGLFGTSS